MKRRVFDLMLANIIASYCVYLVEDIRLWTEHVPIEPMWTIGAPVFAPVALVYVTLLDHFQSWLLLQLWISYLVPAILAYWLFAKHFNRKTFAAGMCTQCGYDLRASPDRCPECGMPTSTG